MYTNGPNRRREVLATNLCTLLRPCGRHGSAIVYTNAPNRRPTALITNLCTLLRPHGCWSSQQCTQMPQNDDKRPSQLICVHYCGPRLPTTLAPQQCTQMPQNDAERPSRPICVHSCGPRSHIMYGFLPEQASHGCSPRCGTGQLVSLEDCLAGGEEITRMKGLCVWGCPGIAQVLFLYRWKFLLWSRALDSPRFCVWGEASWRQGCVNS